MATRRKTRDYRAEYLKRLERAKKAGFTTAQARGHPRKREPGLGELGKIRRQLRSEHRDVRKVAYGKLARFGFRREQFVDLLHALGFTENEAYSFWHSPK